MEPFKYHVYVCTQEKPDGAPCCAARGSVQVLDARRAEIGRAGLDGDVQVTTCGSVGLCERGPNMVVYPEGVWYVGVKVEDVPEIVREHFERGKLVARLANTDTAALKAEISENRRKAIEAMRTRAAAQTKK
jgi:(2Fe-2S) ferredoxin